MREKIAYLSSEKLIQILFQQYNVVPSNSSHVSISEYSQGYMNHVFKVEFTGPNQSSEVDNKYVVVLYNSMRYRGEKGFAFLTTISQVSHFLNQNNCISRQAIENNDGEFVSKIFLESTFSQSNPRYLGVYKYIDGNTLEWDAYTRRHLRSAGMKMAQMHELFNDFSGNISAITEWQNYFLTDSIRLTNYLKKNENHVLTKLGITMDWEKIGAIISKIPKLKESSNQLIHCDFVRGNILFSDKKLNNIYEITGILDFEKMLIGPTEVDIARTLAFLYVDCRYKTSLEIEQYFIKEGYLLLGHGNPLNVSQLGLYMIYFWLRDLWKFLECNPYEDLKKNYHFNKTIEILVEKGVVKINY